MVDSIPTEARERAQAILTSLDAALFVVFDRIPEGPNTALVFRIPEQV